jgi:cytochrome b involved in lipid metabolism
LVILENLVLDVGDYMDNHPGGRFLLEHTVGRDISKFFYGGYALDGNATGQALANAHSNQARAQVESLIVAQLIPNLAAKGAQLVPFSAHIIKREPANAFTNTITFEI